MTEAIKQGVPFADYRALDGLNASAIKKGMTSILHMRDAIVNDSPVTPAMRWGSLCHSLVLETEAFGKKVNVFDGIRRGDEWNEHCENNDVDFCVKFDELAKLRAVVLAILPNRTAINLIDKTKHEVCIEWKGDGYGKAKARLDGYDEKLGILEYKTTNAITPHAFFNNSYKMGYHLQLGWYALGIKELTGMWPNVTVLVQEQKSPYDCYVCPVSDSIVKAGADTAIEIAKRYRIAESTGFFRGVADGEMVDFELPEWASENSLDVDMEGVE